MILYCFCSSLSWRGSGNFDKVLSWIASCEGMIEVAGFLRRRSWYDKVGPSIQGPNNYCDCISLQGVSSDCFIIPDIRQSAGKDVISLIKVASEMLLTAGPCTSLSKYTKGWPLWYFSRRAFPATESITRCCSTMFSLSPRCCCDEVTLSGPGRLFTPFA